VICRSASLGLSIAIAVAWSRQSSATNPDQTDQQYMVDRWGSDKGLNGEVHAIQQTPDGYLWIGTDRGLFRFDGLNFRFVSDPRLSALTNPDAIDLTVAQGSLFVRLPERNLLRYANGTFENILDALQPRELAVTSMCRGRGGDLLLSGLVNGLLRYKDGQFENIAPITSLPSSPIVAMAQTTEGKIWLGTRDAGLFYVDRTRIVAVSPALPGRHVNSLLADGLNLWIGTDVGIVRWNGTTINTEGTPASLRHAQPLAMLEDHHANLWVGAKSGLYRANADRDFLESREFVNVLFEDRERNLWAGGPWGIERRRESTFWSYGKAEGLPSDRNGPIYSDSDGRIWFAPLEGGLFWLKGTEKVQMAAAALKEDVVYSIAGINGDIWIGRQRGGLAHLRYQKGNASAETFTQAEGLAQNSVYSVYQSRDGSVWAGTLTGGLSKFHDGKFTNYSSKDGLASNTVSSILEGSDGTMWFATPNGLRALSNGRWRGYTVSEGLPSDDVYCLTEDSKGILWIGTAAGVAFFAANHVAAPKTTLELLHDPVFGLAEDKTGWLWVATANHMLRVHRDKLLRGVVADGDLRVYTLDDGLRSVEGVRRDRSVVADPLGRIWFSVNNGLAMVNPAELADNPAPAIVSVQSISADNKIIDLRDPVRIPARPLRVTVDYSGVLLRDPDRVRFRYKLEGYDPAWSEPTPQREVAYTNLSPRKYRFRLIASNSDGVWNSTEAALGFEVSPLFWQTWWFRLVALLTIAFIALGLYRLRIHQLTTQLNVRFDERLAERTRIAEELHDTLLQGFLSASMQLHVTVDSLPSNSTAKQSLTRVLELMRQVTDEGRRVLEGLRSSHGGFLNLEQAFSQIRHEFNVPNETVFRVIVDGQPRPLHPASRDDIYRIGREALSNAFRHSRASEIDLEIKYSPKQLRLFVRDNGRGVDPSMLSAAENRGLLHMRERAEGIGGKLRVWSRSSAGTEIELCVPGRVAFQPSNRSQRWFARKKRVSA
jgi:signal transduction histidine kinase/ligand-binding sensor domain-containing protein